MLAYPSVAFVLLQVVEFFINNYGLDHRYLTASLFATIVLLPAAFIWNWRHGEAGKQRISKPELGAYAVFGVAAIAAVTWYWTTTPAQLQTVARDFEPARSVAVMPFVNGSDDADVQYLCDGIAESLINWLATVEGIKAISKTAAFRLRDQADDTAAIRNQLGADSVIRGRLEKRGDQIVISASLVDTRDDSQLWGERLTRPHNEVMYLERSIVAAIKNGLRIKIEDPANVHAASGGTNDPEAYQHYLRGHFLIQATEPESIDLGLDDLRTAISIDPKFALPYTDIAAAMVQKVMYGMHSDDSLKGEARNAAYTAVALAPELAEAHTALAAMHETITFDWRAAEEAYEAAISLSPQGPHPYRQYSDFLWATLRFERGLEMARRGLEIDPRDAGSMHAIGISLLYSGDFAGAAAAFEQWNQFYPGGLWSYVKYALALALDGQCDKAATPAATAERRLQGRGSPLIHTWLALGYQVCGRDDLYAVSKSRLDEYLIANPDSLDVGVLFYRVLEGDVDGAIGLVRGIIEAKTPATLFLQIFMLDHMQWPLSDTLSRDPRLRKLIKDLDFPPTKWVVNQ
jgi:TolB-like protein/Tfp pilus assembly protein PilF